MRLLDTTSNEVIDLSNAENPDSVIPGIISGEVAPDLDATYKVKFPGGRLGDVPGAQLESALKSGASFYGKNDLIADQDKERFGSFPQQAAAGLLGGARGLSLGLSDQILTKTGAVSPEYLQKQEEFNPEIGLTGEIAGAVAPALFSGGSSVAGNILSKTPAALASTLGREAGLLGLGAAEKLGAKSLSPLVSKVVTKATELGLGSAAESSLFGVGKAVSEAAIQNKPLTAEAVLADGGYGFLTGLGVGSVLGGGASLAGEGIKKAAGKISDIVGEGGNKLETGLIQRRLGAGKKQMEGALGNAFKAEAANDVTKAAMANLDNANGFDAAAFKDAVSRPISFDGAKMSDEALLSNIQNIKKTAGEKIGETLDSLSTPISSDKIIQEINKSTESLNKYDLASRKEIQSFLNDFQAVAGIAPDETGALLSKDIVPNELFELRKLADENAKFNQNTSAPVRKIFGEIRTNLENLMKTEIEDKLGGQVLKDYNLAKKAYYGASGAEQVLSGKMGGDTARNMISLGDRQLANAGAMISGGAGAIAGAALGKITRTYGDRAALFVISQLEKRAGTLNKLVDDSISGLVGAARKGGTISTISTAGDKNKSYDTKVKELEEQQLRIEEIKNGINDTLSGMGAAAPETALQLRDKTLNAMDFLNAKLPKKPENNPFVQYQVPESEIDKFNRYAVAVENPSTIMKNLKGGYISPEEVEVLKKVYPEIHLKLKTKALDLLSQSKKGKDVNYQLRIQLQKLLDTKADVNLYPTSIKSLQQSFQNPQQSQQSSQPAKLPGSRAKGLNLGASLSSGLESTLRRRS